MTGFQEVYNIISDYICNPTVLKVATGIFITGGLVCLSASAYILNKVRKMGKKDSRLEKNIKENGL